MGYNIMNIEFPTHIQTWKHNSAVNNDTMRQILTTAPNVVVDIGAGDGFYGKLVRYCLPMAVTIAVEKREDYILQWKLKEIYNEVLNDDVVRVIDTLTGDLIIFGDVLEHLEKSSFVSVLDVAVKRFKYILINSPVGFQPQPHQFEEEIHRCGISNEDFKNYRIIEYHAYCNNLMFNCLLGGKEYD